MNDARLRNEQHYTSKTGRMTHLASREESRAGLTECGLLISAMKTVPGRNGHLCGTCVHRRKNKNPS